MKTYNKLILILFAALILTLPIFLLFPTRSNKVLKVAGFYESPFSSDAGFLLEALVKEYRTRYPKESIEFHQEVTIDEYNEWISSAILRGKEPDVFFMTSQLYSELYDKGIMKEIVVAKELENFCNEKKIDAQFVKHAGYGEEIYAIPVAADFTLMAVNKSLLRGYGIDKVNDAWAWSDYQRMCRVINKDNSKYGFDWEDAVYSNGGKVVDYLGREDYLNSLNVLNAINFVYRLNEGTSTKVAPRDFRGGKLVFEKLNATECINMNFPVDEVDFLAMPAGPKGGNISKAECVYVCIGKHSNNVEKAKRFIDIVLSSKIQSEIVNSGYAMPVTKLSNDLISDETVRKLCILSDKVLPSAFIVHRFRDDKYIFDIIDKRIEDAIKSGVKLDNALSELHIEISDFLSKRR